MARSLVAPASLLVLACLLLGCSSAAAKPSRKSGKDVKLSFEILPDGWVLTGGKNGDVGATYWFTQVAKANGKTYDMPGWCSNTAKLSGGRALWACNYQYDLDGGSVMVQGIYKADAKDVWTGTLAVVGGTGMYKGVSGEEFQIWDNANEKGTATVTLRF